LPRFLKAVDEKCLARELLATPKYAHSSPERLTEGLDLDALLAGDPDRKSHIIDLYLAVIEQVDPKVLVNHLWDFPAVVTDFRDRDEMLCNEGEEFKRLEIAVAQFQMEKSDGKALPQFSPLPDLVYLLGKDGQSLRVFGPVPYVPFTHQDLSSLITKKSRRRNHVYVEPAFVVENGNFSATVRPLH
jgi:hypothetical protein